MTDIKNKTFFIGSPTTTAILLFLIAGLLPYLHSLLPLFNTAEAGGAVACISYDETQNTISVNCNASFLDVVQSTNDPDLIENLGNGEYLLNANLQVVDGVTFQMTSNADGLQYLKLAGENGIIVYGTILIDGVKITSWDVSNANVIQQDATGAIPRGYIHLSGSEGSQIINSEFGYLGSIEAGRRGLDVLGGANPSHDMMIRGSKFHDMWMGFYSNAAYNITVDGNEYYNNIKYSLDPHTTTHDMNITNNWIHNNPIGPICSDRCWDILIDGNLVQDTTNAAIFFSRNMTDSIARNNHIVNAGIGILLSESPNNHVYNNTIEGASFQGIRLLNPEIPDDGITERNSIYNNTILNSDEGIGAARSQNNILENNNFSGIESSEYLLSGGSDITIQGQHFDNAIISEGGSAMAGNVVEIVDSGTIGVTGGEEDESEVFNTDNEPYTTTLGDGDSITINSS